jgi:isopentenyl-diphosphate delta-isomerase
MDHVVLLSDAGEPVGVARKADAHGAATPLHLAFSCFLSDEAGRVLVTRRALGKRSWPGVWTTSFCGHPGPGEDMADAVRRHARDELGVGLADLHVVLPDFRYRAVDPAGVVENEVCPVFRARPVGPVRPAPDEVLEHVWVDPSDLARAARLTPWAFSPWLVLQLDLLDRLPTAEATA